MIKSYVKGGKMFPVGLVKRVWFAWNRDDMLHETGVQVTS